MNPNLRDVETKLGLDNITILEANLSHHSTKLVDLCLNSAREKGLFSVGNNVGVQSEVLEQC